MRTRAAEKHNINLKTAATLSSSPNTPTTPTTPSTPTKKSKLSAVARQSQEAPKKIKVIKSVKGEWDKLPHGIGKKGDLVPDDPFVNYDTVETDEFLIPTRQKEEAPPVSSLSAAKENNSLQIDLLEISQVVDQKIKDHLHDETLPKVEKKKRNQYGLTPGSTPFPEHIGPIAKECEKVNRLLSELHGKFEQPELIPAPSLLVAGCGEVPDPIDAILRTLLSATTRAINSNLALSGLQRRYGLQETGKGKGSIKWNDVRIDSLPNIETAIKSGGLAHVKAISLKKVTNQVYLDNLQRLQKLVKERSATEFKENATTLLDIEIADLLMNPLTLEWLYSMTTNEIMEYLTSLPGVGVKTAACVLLFNFKRPCFAVDTHVWRHAKWLGWVPTKATRDKAFSHLDFLIPDHLKYSLHQLFLRHGKSCFRCKGNTKPGSKEWEQTECPIDHLLTRDKENKHEGTVSPKKLVIKAAGNKKRKIVKDGDEEDEEGAEWDDVAIRSSSAKATKRKK